MLKRTVAVLLAFMMMLSLAACTNQTIPAETSGNEGTKNETTQKETEKTESAKQDDETSKDAETDEEQTGNAFVQNEDGSFISGGIKFPLEEPVTYSWYRTADAITLDLTNGDLNNNEFIQEFTRRTNIHFDFRVPALGTEQEQFTLMFSSDNLPDIICGASNYSEGLDGGVDDGYYLDLTDLIPQYMPEYEAALKSQGDYVDMFTEQGRQVALAMLYTHEQAPIAGFVIRQDWLDELGLAMPETFDELEEVLTQFKEKKGCTAPISFSKFGLFALAYGYNVFFTAIDTSGSSYPKDGKIVDVLLENPQDMKAYLERLHSWFDKGLLDANFMSTKGYMPDAALMNSGASGVTYCMYAQIETKFKAAEEEGANIVAMPFPRQNKGDKLHMTPGGGFGRATAAVAINAECKNPEILLAAFNYLFTEPGFVLANYGVEGDTYNIVDGEIVLTEKMTEDVENGIRLYTMPSGWGPMWVEPDREDAAFSPKVKEAQLLWDSDDHDMRLPTSGYYFTNEEKSELADILADLLTFEEEYYLKVVTGAASTDDFDKFVEDCKGMGLERANEIKDAAYQRYLARKAASEN